MNRQMKTHAIRQFLILAIRHNILPILITDHDRIGRAKTIRDVAYERLSVSLRDEDIEWVRPDCVPTDRPNPTHALLENRAR